MKKRIKASTLTKFTIKTGSTFLGGGLGGAVTGSPIGVAGGVAAGYYGYEHVAGWLGKKYKEKQKRGMFL